MRTLAPLIVLIAMLLAMLAIVAHGADSAAVEWDYDHTEGVVVVFEIDLQPLIVTRGARGVWGPWTPHGAAFDNYYGFGFLADGVYLSRVRALLPSGSRSEWSNLCAIRVPYVPPATHVRLTVLGPAGVVATFTAPLASRAFYRLAGDGTPQVMTSVDSVTWRAIGPGGPAGDYSLETTQTTLP